MHIFLPYRGQYGGTAATIALARAFTGCPVVVANDHPRPGEFHWDSFRWSRSQMDRLYPHIGGKGGPFLSVYRWFMTLEAIRAGWIQLPVFVIDWDMLLFYDLKEALGPFRHHEYSVSLADGSDPRDSSAAYSINRIEPLEDFCTNVMHLVDTHSEELFALQDMAAWRMITNTGKYSVGNLHRIEGGGLFDHNMACRLPCLQSDETGYKRLVWEQQKPYFVTPDGKLVRAHVVHCWGEYKNREIGLAAQAGITL